MEEYTLTYYITILPNLVLYAGMTSAQAYFHFDDFHIPQDYKQQYIECIFCLFNKEGVLVKSAHTQATDKTVKMVLNTYPLKMLIELLKEIKGQ